MTRPALTLPPYIIDVSDRVPSAPVFDRPERCQCCHQFPEVDVKPRYALYRGSPKRRTRARLGEICHDCLRQGLPYLRRPMRIWADLQEWDARRLRDVLRQRFELSPDAKALEGHV